MTHIPVCNKDVSIICPLPERLRSKSAMPTAVVRPKAVVKSPMAGRSWTGGVSTWPNMPINPDLAQKAA